MENRRSKITMLFYLLMIVITIICISYLLGLIKGLNGYYISLLIPTLLILFILLISYLLKCGMLFGEYIFSKNDEEMTDKVEVIKNKINEVLKYSLLLVFLLLLIIVMVLDIILCIKKAMYVIMLFSIGSWLLMIYLILRILLK